MPNSTLPPDDYLGDPQRLTSEFQDQINNLQNWVNTLQSELDVLSGTTLREGAVRQVGTGGNELPTNDDLSSAANVEADQNLRTTDVVQFSQIKDAASPGNGDFDSSKLGYWEDTVELGGNFDPGESVKCVRIGNMVIISATSTLSHSSGNAVSSDSGAVPAAYRPSVGFENVFYDTRNSGGIEASISISTAGRITMRYEDDSGNAVQSTGVVEAPSICFNV